MTQPHATGSIAPPLRAEGRAARALRREITRRLRHMLGRPGSIGAGQPARVIISAQLAGSHPWRGIIHAAGLAIHHASGAIFASDPLAHCIYRLRPGQDAPESYVIEAIIGHRAGDQSVSEAAAFNNPRGLALDARGNLWIADTGNHRVVRLDSASTRDRFDAPDAIVGQLSRHARLAGCAADRLCAPADVAIGPDGALWIADTENHRVLAFAPTTLDRSAARADLVLGQQSFVTCQSGKSAAMLDEPASVCVEQDGTLWIGDSGNLRVMRHDAGLGATPGQAADGVLGSPQLDRAGTGGWTDRTFGYAEFIAVDDEGCLWVSDPDGHRLMWWQHAALKPNGAPADGIADRVLVRGDGCASDVPTLSWPAGLATTDGGVLVADAGNGRLVRFMTGER